MNVAIWQITNENEIIFLQDNRIVFADTIDEENKLESCFRRLRDYHIDELYVMILPTVTNEILEGTYKVREFTIAKSIKKYSLVCEEDLNQIKELCQRLNIPKAKIYDTFSVYPLIASSAPTIICGENINETYSYAYVDTRGIQDFRIARNPSPDIIASMREMYDNPVTTTFYSKKLLAGVVKMIDNFAYLEGDDGSTTEMLMLAPALSLLRLNAPLELTNVKYENEEAEEINIPDDISDDFLESINTELNDKKPLKQPREEREELELKDKSEKKHKLEIGTLALDVVGGVVAVILGFSILANKEMPKDISYLQDKATQVESLVEPKQDTVTYYNDYLKGLQSGKNIDADVIDQISKIKVNGVLAETRLNQNKVGVMIYLKNPKDIDGVKDELGKIFKVTGVNDEGAVSVGSTSLNKYTVNGTL